MDRVSIAIPYYGPQEAEFWSQLVTFVATLHYQDIDFCHLHVIGAMATDYNRNSLVNAFLKTDVEWLFWIDADTLVPPGALRRLLNLGKTLASGLYYGKAGKHPPIAYYRTAEGAYIPIDRGPGWERGEIIPVDATGFGCMLTHRSVFEAIRSSHVVYQRQGGGITAIHKDDILDAPGASLPRNRRAGKLKNGVYHERLIAPTVDDLLFPYFVIEYGRTEDMWFFEKAARVGHKVWLDTSIECGHVRAEPFTGADYRKYIQEQENESP